SSETSNEEPVVVAKEAVPDRLLAPATRLVNPRSTFTVPPILVTVAVSEPETCAPLRSVHPGGAPKLAVTMLVLRVTVPHWPSWNWACASMAAAMEAAIVDGSIVESKANMLSATRRAWYAAPG